MMLINKIKLLLVSLFINNLISQSIFFGPWITLNFSSPGCSCMLTSCPPQNKGSCLRYPWSSILSRYLSSKRITSHNWEILQPNLVEPSFQQLTLTELMVRKKGSKKGRKTLLELKQLLHDNSSLLKNNYHKNFPQTWRSCNILPAFSITTLAQSLFSLIMAVMVFHQLIYNKPSWVDQH